MARPTKEQQEEKKRLEALNNGGEGATINQEPNTPNPGAEGVVGNGNTPGTNTHEGILQQQAEAEKDAGLIPVNEEKPVDPLEINAEKIGSGSGEENTGTQAQADGTETELTSQEGVVTPLDNSTSQESQEAGVQAGDPLPEAKQKIDDLREEQSEGNTADLSQGNQESTDNTNEGAGSEQPNPGADESEEEAKVTQEDLNQYPGIEAAGIKIGDPKNEETFKKYSDFVEANPHYYPKDHPNYKAEEKPPVNEGDKDNYVYHGDFLTESQIGRPVTFDWDEVTAPEHLAIRPEVPPPFTDGKKQ